MTFPTKNNNIVIIRIHSVVCEFITTGKYVGIQRVQQVGNLLRYTVPIVSVRAFKDFNLRTYRHDKLLTFRGNIILYGQCGP